MQPETILLPPEACRATVTCDLPQKFEVDTRLYPRCTFENTGAMDFYSTPPHPVRIGIKWFAAQGESGVPPFIDGNHFALPHPLASGQRVEFFPEIETPSIEGRYELVITLVQEQGDWFDNIDPASAFRSEVTVAKNPAGSMAAEIAEIVSDRDWWPAGREATEEAGIVISGCGRFFKPLHANLKNIRLQGCDLPIDVWHLPGEFTRKQMEALAGMANFAEAATTPYNNLSGSHAVHGFKAWMLAHSRFRRTLMLDVNNYLLQNPASVFESNHACILWQDGWSPHLPRLKELRDGLGIPVHSHEFESGQLYVNKSSPEVRDALRLAAALNALGGRLYWHTYGDKETYALAFDLLRQPFTVAPAPLVRYPAAANGEAGLTQPWLDGSPLFLHAMRGGQEHWWKHRTEWEALACEALEAEALCR